VEYPVASSDAATAVMRGNRKRDTKPELALRRALHARGRRYRVNVLIRVRDVRVRPDIVFTAARLAVFVDGCFWHGCSEHGTQPRSNPQYWGPKIARNQARDLRNTNALEAAGWRVVRAWEHEPVHKIVVRVEALLGTHGRTSGHSR
jgi:DNA mismatch endonuclease (patch repair protein)